MKRSGHPWFSLVFLCNHFLGHRVSGSMFCCVNIEVFCIVHLGLGLNYIQVFGLEETMNKIDKPSVEPHNKVTMDSKYAFHILKRTEREGISRGIVD